jgi:hypothetical protein
MWKKPGETKKIEKRKKRRVLELFGVKKTERDFSALLLVRAGL